MDRLRIWCNRTLSDAAERQLRAGVREHSLVHKPDFSGDDADLLAADVVFGVPTAEALLSCQNLRWLHVSSAGWGTLDRPDVRHMLKERNIRMTKSSVVYAEPCAEHLLACMLAHGRSLPFALDNQRTHQGWPQAATRRGARLLTGQHAVIFGGGAIATRIVELLAPFDMVLTCVRRHPTGKEAIPTLAITDPAVADVLSKADHVINTLPGNAETELLFDRPRFGQCRRGAVFYNVGRGSTVDQDALLSALRSRHLDAAFLDVTTPEPLPSDHPLWKAPRCVITPHSAGGHHDETERLVEHFLENLRRFENGEDLVDVVF